MVDGTYGITGLPRPADAVKKTKEIPYVTGLPVRYEISTLGGSKDPDLRMQWTLFILALEKFKQIPVDQKLSYFQVAGIHGYPETSWDHAPDPRKDPVNPGKGEQPFGGYCNHNGLNFPTWHRPYMLLFEQCIWENMKEVIDHWVTTHGLQNNVQKWRDAADQWRMPYWDWARQQTYTQDFAYPKVMTQPTVRIYPPAEVLQYYVGGNYPNPLWGFDNPERGEDGDPLPFGSMPEGKTKWNIKDDPNTHPDLPPQNDDDENQWYPWSRATGISRYGILLTKDKKEFRGLDGVNNPWEANNQLAAARFLQKQDPNNISITQNPGNLADCVNRMFSGKYNRTWGEFASTKWSKEGNTDYHTGYMSLEYIHNNVHNYVGGMSYETGIGHMMDVPVAAFDPIFWLHHTQIDRLLAIWQCLYPERWWDQPERIPDVKIPEKPPNVRDDQPDDPLQPFHTKHNGDPNVDVYTARKCRDWTELNYQYDDLMALSKDALADDETLDEPTYKKHLKDYIDSIYPSTAVLINAIKKDQNEPVGLTPVGPDTDDKTKSWNDYIINVVYDRYALKGRSYSIEFYLGGPKNDKKTRVKRGNYVGQVYNFGGGSRSSEGSCSNCKTQSDAGVLSCAQVPLTIQLLHHVFDNDKDHPIDDFTDIEKYLELHLSWRYVGPGGVVVNPSKFPNTKITVLRGEGELREPRLAPALPSPAQLKVGVDMAQTVGPQDNAAPKLVIPAVYGKYQPLPGVTRGKFGEMESVE